MSVVLFQIYTTIIQQSALIGTLKCLLHTKHDYLRRLIHFDKLYNPVCSAVGLESSHPFASHCPDVPGSTHQMIHLIFFVEKFLDMLTKAQSSRIDDQRGLSIDVGDLPEFLKSSSDQHSETDEGSTSPPCIRIERDGALNLHLPMDR